LRGSRYLTTIAFLVVATPVCALPATQIALKGTPHHATVTLATDTADYIRGAAMNDMFEVNAAKVALDKSQDFDVQRFARMALSDYGANGAALAATLSQDAFEMTLPEALDDPHALLVDQLEATADTDFDVAYMQAQIMAQESALRLHARYARTGRDQALRAYAKEVLPQIRLRLTVAEQILQKISPKTASTR
jgi:putative membrane protein